MPMGVYPRSFRSLQERFWSHVDKTDTCWLWRPSAKSGDYGRIREYGRSRKLKAHRVSWEIHFGPLDAGQQVLHKCDNPPCVRPDHLFIGSPATNAADRVAKNRQAKGQQTGVAKLNPDLVRAIRKRLDECGNQRQTAREFGVSSVTVCWIANGKTWKHVT